MIRQTDRRRTARAARVWRLLAPVLPLLVLTSTVVGAGEGSLEGDPFRGRRLLSEKLCTQCHSVWGHGGLVGPDMPAVVANKSWLELVGEFWNHTPRMLDAVANRGYTWPTLDRGEMADLLSYLYYLRLFDAPGDPRRGSITFTQLQCVSCHSLGGRGGTTGGALDAFSAYASPVVLAQAMWNAGPVMQQQQLARGTDIPNFASDEMADIQAFIRTQGLRRGRTVELLPLPSPARGAVVFEAKRCGTCHRAGGRGEGPDLASASIHLSVSEVSGVLWNHSYAMHDLMRARGIPFPEFEGTEFADLISFLHFLGFFGEHGRAEVGESIFIDRGCAACHAGSGAMAPALSSSAAVQDPIALSASMWNHAPTMHRLMGEQAVAWPKFDPGEMEHLAAYLQRLVRREGSRKREGGN